MRFRTPCNRIFHSALLSTPLICVFKFSLFPKVPRPYLTICTMLNLLLMLSPINQSVSNDDLVTSVLRGLALTTTCFTPLPSSLLYFRHSQISTLAFYYLSPSSHIWKRVPHLTTVGVCLTLPFSHLAGVVPLLVVVTVV